MHPCLNVSEILINIFNSVLQEFPSDKPPETMEWPETGSGALAALARTCKAFSEPSLDILWRRQPSLAPLLYCLPTDCYRTVTQVSRDPLFGKRIMTITRDLLPNDTERIYYHGKRIKCIGFNYYAANTREQALDPHVLGIIPDAIHGYGRLLPNIRHLHMALSEFDGEAPTAYAELVIGPSLQTISLSFIDFYDEPLPTDDSWNNVDSLLSPSSSTLTAFTVTVLQAYPVPVQLGAPNTIKVISKSFTHLEVLNIHPLQITHEVLILVATMMNLKTLKCSIDGAELSLFNQTTTSPGHFSNLMTLSVDTLHLCTFGEFLERPGFRALQSLEVLRRGDIGRWDLNAFFEIFRSKNIIPKLTSLSLSKFPADSTIPSYNVSPVTTQTFAPLFSRNMKIVNINLNGPTEINNKTLEDLAEAWPNLECLGLGEPTTETRPCVTFDGIISLLSMCPDLQTLSLRFNAQATGPFMAQGQGKLLVCGEKLKVFNVCTSPVVESTPWVGFLPYIFPNLSSLEYGWVSEEDVGLEPLDNPFLDCWRRIHDALCPFLKANER